MIIFSSRRTQIIFTFFFSFSFFLLHRSIKMRQKHLQLPTGKTIYSPTEHHIHTQQFAFSFPFTTVTINCLPRDISVPPFFQNTVTVLAGPMLLKIKATADAKHCSQKLKMEMRLRMIWGSSHNRSSVELLLQASELVPASALPGLGCSLC